MSVTEIFTQFKGLIGKGYDNPELLALLTGAKPGKTITNKEIREAGAYLKDFDAQDPRYMESVSGGFKLTQLGSTLIHTQMIADSRGKPSSRSANSNTGSGHKSYGTMDKDMLFPDGQ